MSIFEEFDTFNITMSLILVLLCVVSIANLLDFYFTKFETNDKFSSCLKLLADLPQRNQAAHLFL